MLIKIFIKDQINVNNIKKRKNMRIKFIPKTFLGKLSVILIMAFLFLFIIFQLLVFAGQRGGETFFDNLLLTIPIFLAGIFAIAAFVTGLISIIKNKERAVLVYIITLIGLFILWFVVGEIVVPH